MWTLIIPTLDAAESWNEFRAAILACTAPGNVIIVDSSSKDGTPDMARAAGFRVHSIDRSEFNHGGTRQRIADLCSDSEILVYLTQDAVLSGADSIQHLLDAFEDPAVAAAYGRQLPRVGAGFIEAHARRFNYPAQSEVRDLESRNRIGFKSIFISNSFAAYRRSSLIAVGGFPEEVIFGEDTIVAAKLLKADWKIAYVAEAQVYHSHSYSWTQEFKRYFDIGVLHSRESWLLGEFGGAGSEGRKFVLSEMKYLWCRNALLIPSALIRTVFKLLGYRLGRREETFSSAIKRRLSMHRSFWDR